ncbi:MAG: adenylate/guanylate cyclase domain-containing protein [Bacteroidales bacterium]
MGYTIFVMEDGRRVEAGIEASCKASGVDVKIESCTPETLISDFPDPPPDALVIEDAYLSDIDRRRLLPALRICRRMNCTLLCMVDFATRYQLDNWSDFAFDDFIVNPFRIEEFIFRHEFVKRNYKQTLDKDARLKHLEELSLVALSAANSVAIFDPDGSIDWVNDGFVRMYECSLNEYLSRLGVTKFSPPSHPLLFRAIEDARKTRESVVYENDYFTPSNRRKWIQTTLSPIFDEEGTLIKYVVLESDITGNKIAEERLEAKNDHLLTLAEHLESTNELLERQRKEIETQKEFIEEQKRKSDELLLNILPFETAEQLKKKGFAKSKLYRRVTVMFTDFKDFSSLAQQMSAQDLIKELNTFFQVFDEVVEEHFIEKIKTIGDAYMCAGGLPLRNKSNPFDVTLAALRIQQFMRRNYLEQQQRGEIPWSLRLGIHTGEVIAGVIGKKKFAYDIWGDTVNTAARMQEGGEVEKVNVSGDTYNYIKDYFVCTHRGPIGVKNKGEIEMYYVERLKPEFSADKEGVIPNKEFRKILSTY